MRSLGNESWREGPPRPQGMNFHGLESDKQERFQLTCISTPLPPALTECKVIPHLFLSISLNIHFVILCLSRFCFKSEVSELHVLSGNHHIVEQNSYKCLSRSELLLIGNTMR